MATKGEFTSKTVGLSQTKTSEAEDAPQDANNLPMSGDIKVNGSTSFTLAADEVSASASLSRLVARVAITNIQTAFNPTGQYSAATFKIKKIFLHNAASTSTVGTGTPTTTTPVTGRVDGTNGYLQDALSDVDITSSACTTSYWFYTFATPAGGVSSAPTKLVIYGSFDADGAGATTAEDVYYPVVVNKLQTGTTINDGNDITSAGSGKGDMTIARNTRYNITATIKGKGVSDPDTDINPAVISLSVTVANWDLTISQDVTFN